MGHHGATRCAPGAKSRRRNRIRLANGVAAVALFLAPALGTADDSHKPTRIVSLNLCTDELVLRLADRRNIASVTYLAETSSVSNVADLARQIPINHGLA